MADAVPTPILQIALPTPLHGSFDYLPPQGVDACNLRTGIRVQVPFGKRKAIGILLHTSQSSAIAPARLRHALALLDSEPLLSDDLLALCTWASRYYHHPIGEVIATALPPALRNGQAASVDNGVRYWRLTESGRALSVETLRRAPRQAALLQQLQHTTEGLAHDVLAADDKRIVRLLQDKGWIENHIQQPNHAPPTTQTSTLALNVDQLHAAEEICASLHQFASFVVDGVTGSGKTEVYLKIIQRVIDQGRQALVLVPEIGLTPQLIQRFEARLGVPLAIFHSGRTDQERLEAWLHARSGRAPVVIGTRSAVFAALHTPGVIIIDEEHDLSFKQQEGFRYHARDLAVWRARQLNIPVVLGSATPSLETLYNVERGRYRRLLLPQRAGAANLPDLRVIDLRRQPMTGNLSDNLLRTMEHHLQQGNQVLLFLNRRGYAPTLLCHQCGWIAHCKRCDAHLTYHRGSNRLRCHHCGGEQAMITQCPSCNTTEFRSLGHGTERVEDVLSARFPAYSCARIDRDSTRRKGALQKLLGDALSGHHRILLGTQMLAKGHHLPQVTLAAILDGDQGLFGVDFRANERIAQLITQVAGRAGRAEQRGEVVIQTHYPDHPLLHILLNEGYHHYAAAALKERQAAELPPYVNLALLRAEATAADHPTRFLREAVALANQQGTPGIMLLGPIPSPMERRAGRYRAQLLIQATQRADLHRFLDVWLPALNKLPQARKVRWSIDVDPMEMV